jgi:cytosine/creatinine deaminase
MERLDRCMREAIEQARLGLSEGGIPIGSVLAREGEILGRGRNRRIQQNNPILHAEIDCLQNAGRIGKYQGTVLYSTLMPCSLCSGAIVLFKIPTVIIGESRNFSGDRTFLESHGVEVIDLDLAECRDLLGAFIRSNPGLWNEDIGQL